VAAAVLVGSQVLASAGPTTPRLDPPVPGASSNVPDDEDEGDDDGDGDGGNAHSRAVHAWVTCKAVEGKEACVKPAPPGKALGHGHGWGRAHAPGQLKTKDRGDDDQDTDDPTS
jgi:hypothetical protein